VRRRFVTIDVFTTRRFAGNPLAVVLDPQGLDTAAMQAVAREFNLSETVFVLPPADPTHRAKLRIFTPAVELPFAGHPTVGAAVQLARLDGSKVPRQIMIEEDIGPVHCLVEAADADRGHARFELPRLPEEIGSVASTTAIAAALSIDIADIGFPPFAPACWSVGNGLTFVPLRGLDPIRRSRPDLAHWDAAFPPPRTGAYLFCQETIEPGHAFHARMFAPRVGVPEDPATGAGVAAFAGMYARLVASADGDQEIIVEQGFEIGRPSLIHLWVTMRGGKLVGAAVGGEAVVVSEGTIEA
jgi:trans-2,3-dihydro-3-hydroxyanthranilate isomerase